MESLLNRYRNITVLLLVIFAQLVLLAVQVKNDQDVRVIRLWTVTAVTPAARVVEWFRGGSIGFIRNYLTRRATNEENIRLQDEVGRLKMENIFLKNELAMADRAKALQLFQEHSPSKTLAANVIGIGAGSNSNVLFVNRSSVEGVMRGMAVVTPDGIVGKVIAAYPTASEVLKITDPDFAAGVISQKNHVRGVVRGTGFSQCKIEHIPFGEKVEVGEWFYTSGDDRIFPRGLPVGIVKSISPDVMIEPSVLQGGIEDVLIVLQGVYQEIPDTPPSNQPVYVAPQQASPNGAPLTENQPAPPVGTDADKLRAIYKSVGDAQNLTWGDNGVGARAPDFTKLPNAPLPPGAVQTPAGRGAPSAARPGQGTPPGAVPGAVPKQGDPAVRPPATPRPPTGDPNVRPPATPGTTVPKSGDPAATPRPGPADPAAHPPGTSIPKQGDPAARPPAAPPKAGDPARHGNQVNGAPGGQVH